MVMLEWLGHNKAFILYSFSGTNFPDYLYYYSIIIKSRQEVTDGFFLFFSKYPVEMWTF